MSNWRPDKEWDVVKIASKALGREVITICDEYKALIEAGADAMYEPAYQKGRHEEREALRKMGVKCKYWGEDAHQVFIPEDKPPVNISDLILSKTEWGHLPFTKARLHPASVVVEEGYFCLGCGEKVIVRNGVSDGHVCGKEARGIKPTSNWVMVDKKGGYFCPKCGKQVPASLNHYCYRADVISTSHT